ncbi:transcription antitermination factor NusB [Alkaliphilus serpentinus]|uniref:Transcription antitermination protein NusB n=1 Tax=Alkaliphilus serpentinus TaxID=1482731 RepID=A0A833HMD1_9FIRM|nr:transcription antitermination factor NusB [Alkaliphilus serpentinus]KAB3527570.1 transcription antitermination factor NusB [Alkaliphilus serpentinus]
MSRKIARELCMKTLFQMSILKDYSTEVMNRYLEEELTFDGQQDYINRALEATINNMKTIDEIIEEFSKGWNINRIAKVDLAILRLAFGEILYLEDIPYAVSINEAIEMAKKYSSDESDNFINGILGKFVEARGLKKDE